MSPKVSGRYLVLGNGSRETLLSEYSLDVEL